jgi:hypothetical protein
VTFARRLGEGRPAPAPGGSPVPRFARLALALPLLLLLAAAARAGAPLVAEQVTVANAADRLFGGIDADGGIGDWVLSNGIVEAIIDDVALQDDLPAGVTPPPKQSEAGFTGGTLIDLGLVGADNDQLAQMFTVGGLSTENFILYDPPVQASTTASEATITVSGRLLGFDPLLPAELPVVTQYKVAPGDPFLTIVTTVTNQGSELAPMLGGFLDVFLWTGRSQVPFSPLPERGFSHPVLSFADPLAAVEQPAFSAAPGVLGPEDGVVDPETASDCGEVAYGVLGVRASLDEDGPGPLPPFKDEEVERLFGVTNADLTALGNFPLTFGGVVPTGVLSYERRVYVGARNDVDAVAGPMIAALAAREGFETGTLSGNVDARDGADLEAVGIATRRSGPPLNRIPDGAPVTHFRTDASGAFAGVVVPVGTYDVEIRAPERDPVVVTGVEVSAGGDAAVTVPPLSGLGTVELEIVEKQKGPDPLVPGKIVFKGRKDDPDPRFAHEIDAFQLELDPEGEIVGQVDVPSESFGGALAQGNTVYLSDGTGSVRLRPGRYDVYASRGPEYTARRKRVSVREGRTRRVKLALERIVETPGALSGDFHVHSGRSLDTQAGPEGRVVSFAGEGVEVMVSTDHDYHLDYAPLISGLGLGGYLTSIVGVEVTGTVANPPAFPNSVGHINGWPVEVVPDARRRGSIEDEFVAPNWLFSRLRAQGAEVIQYNHPRAGVSGLTSIGIFNNIGCNRCANDIDQTCSVDADCPAAPEPQVCGCVGYQPDRPLEQPPNDELLSSDVTGSSGVDNPAATRNIDFDVMEIGNGISPGGYARVRADWFSLLNQRNAETPFGLVPFIPGTGVSDSHRITLESAGYFRTYVLGSGDDPTALDVADYDARIREGRMVATTGPYLELSLEDAGGTTRGVGETLVPTGAELTAHVRVQASPWVPVDEVRLVVNGVVSPAHVFDAGSRPKVAKRPRNPWSGGRGKVVRFEAEIPLPVGSTDFYVLAEAGAPLDPAPAPDPDASLLVPDFVSLAFTNPVFVDVDGDGFEPPGLSAEGTAQALAPLRSERGRALARAEAERDLRAHPPIHRLRIPIEAARRAAPE